MEEEVMFSIVKMKTYLTMAETLSGLSTCPRGDVGVIILDKFGKAVSFGYNGAPAGMKHCEDVGCKMVEGHCSTAVHGEINGILNGDKERMKGGTIIQTTPPCYRCAQAIITVEISDVYTGAYKMLSTDQQRGWGMLLDANVGIQVDG